LVANHVASGAGNDRMRTAGQTSSAMIARHVAELAMGDRVNTITAVTTALSSLSTS